LDNAQNGYIKCVDMIFIDFMNFIRSFAIIVKLPYHKTDPAYVGLLG